MGHKRHQRSSSNSSREKSSKRHKHKRSHCDDRKRESKNSMAENEMLKRRERMEQWRKEFESKQNSECDQELIESQKQKRDEWQRKQLHEFQIQMEYKSLEKTESKSEQHESNDEIDPLDEYMSLINQQINDLKNQKTTKHEGSKNTTVVRTVANNRNQSKVQKGDIMEQNADMLEYSTEEVSDDDDIFGTKKSKADCISIDHSRIYYRKYRKRFYVEVPEIANMTNEEVEQYRRELDNIIVVGKRCPRPIKMWAQCITYMSILDLLKRYGMIKPTPIQAQSLPIITSGRDMLGIAKTGSGKTLAFLLPMLRHLKAQPPLEPDDGPISLIITPTRELAMQIAKECRRFCKPLDLRVVAVYGGTGISEQIADLKRGTEIVVCTPGRMIDMMSANNGKVTNLRRVTYVVIDEADRMFDMGFEPQVNKILECIRPDRQTVMFSATFPRQMEALARRALTKPIEVVVGGRSVVCEGIEQQVYVLFDDQKYLKLLELLGLYHEHGSVLVFVHKQEHADELMKNLLQSSYPCLALHGGIDQYDRDCVINDFKNGAVRLLVATSVAARGLDVRDLILVVNYDCPNHYEDYVHRCGRTGRAGKKGVAVTFITPNQGKQSGDVIKALELSGAASEIPDELKQIWDEYKSKMAEQGINVKACSGGFGGKGFRFDSEEQAFLDDRKRVQKMMFSMQDSDDDDCVVDIDNEIDKTMKSKLRVKNPTDEPVCEGMIDFSVASDQTPQPKNVEKLAIAKLLASKIGQNRVTDIKDILSFSATNGRIEATGVIDTAAAGKSIAEQIAGRLNNKLNYIPKERSEEVDQFRVYEEELEINDFPQNARWRVTSKETLGHIAEYAEAAITVRGRYFPMGKQPPPGESRLYLIIEALTERGLQLAKAEIKRIIKEEMLKMQNPALQMVNRGRYKVV